MTDDTEVIVGKRMLMKKCQLKFKVKEIQGNLVCKFLLMEAGTADSEQECMESCLCCVSICSVS